MKMCFFKPLLLIVMISISLLASLPLFAQQTGDPDFDPVVENPAYPEGTGPTVYVDHAHFNWHKIDDRFEGFAKLVRKDGYRVAAFTEQFSAESLAKADILVIANPVNEANYGENDSDASKWTLPTPSAFTDEEIDALVTWVEEGNSLLLLADHLPWPGAVSELAKRFGFVMANGFVFKDTFFINNNFLKADANMINFWSRNPTREVSAGNGFLREHPIMLGRNANESIDYVVSFTGHAFWLRAGFAHIRPLMVSGSGTTQYYPDRASLISPATPLEEFVKIPNTPADGLLQGATARHGQGRVAMFSEAAMFTAQISNAIEPGFKMGMNNPNAPYNPQFVLNVVRWLNGLLPEFNRSQCDAEVALIQNDDALTTTIPCAKYQTPFGDVDYTFRMQRINSEDPTEFIFRITEVMEVN